MLSCSTTHVCPCRRQSLAGVLQPTTMIGSSSGGRGDSPMKITKEVLEAYLNCKTKGHLKLAGEAGTKSDYEVMIEGAVRASREAPLARLVARYGVGDTGGGTPLTDAALKKGPPLLVDALLE